MYYLEVSIIHLFNLWLHSKYISFSNSSLQLIRLFEWVFKLFKPLIRRIKCFLEYQISVES